jgi:hypothetical protein
MTTLSIIVSMGFINQKNLGDESLGDEFDHMAAVADAQADIELIIVDRAWPTRWPRVQEALASMLDRVLYVAPRRTELMRRGYRAVSSMRNSGAACSNGEVLAFVDDYILLEPKAAEAVCSVWEQKQRLLSPVYNPSTEPEGEGLHVFSGHNPGVYVCSRADFVALNGFDENYDGAYGEEDTDFEDRLDRLLWLRGSEGALRLRKRGVLFHRTHHENNRHPEDVDRPWPCEHEPSYLRCNRCYFQAVSFRRKEANMVSTNTPLDSKEVERLREHKCCATCGVCRREDRDLQIDSYDRFVADRRVGDYVSADGKREAGAYDPWSDDVTMPWDRS